MLRFFTGALLLFIVSAQRPQRCVSPAQWESRLVEVDPSKQFERRANISYDATNMRIRIIDEVEEGRSERKFYEELFLYKEKTYYIVDLRTKVCNKTTLDKTFRAIEVPSFANFTEALFVGLDGIAGAGVLEDLYEGDDSEGGHYAGAWTDYKCVPVTDAYFSKDKGFIHWSFYDLTPGIKNPAVFEPPAECK